jgi:dTDP-4-amino-4,6-dideoxygalactose transaminase
VAERIGRECLTLPLFPGMTVRQHDVVVDALSEILSEVTPR